MNPIKSISLGLALATSLVAGGETLSITLEDAIARARVQSVNAAVALNELRTSYWEYRTYKAELLPEVNFSSKLPGYYKQYSTYQSEDGTYNFVRNNYMQMKRRTVRRPEYLAHRGNPLG